MLIQQLDHFKVFNSGFIFSLHVFISPQLFSKPLGLVVKVFYQNILSILMFVCQHNRQLTSPSSKAKTASASRRSSLPLPKRDSSGRSASPLQSWGRTFLGPLPELFRFLKAASDICLLLQQLWGEHTCVPARRLVFSTHVRRSTASTPLATRPILLDLWLRKICIPALSANMW